MDHGAGATCEESILFGASLPLRRFQPFLIFLLAVRERAMLVTISANYQIVRESSTFDHNADVQLLHEIGLSAVHIGTVA